VAPADVPRDGFDAIRRFARVRAPVERCDLCGLELPAEHDHLIEPGRRQLACACPACALLFAEREGSRYKRVPRRVVRLEDFALTDSEWEGLRLPISLAFFYDSSPQERMVACYPSPAGATESQLELETWTQIRARHPALTSLASDVEALLVNRTRTPGDYLIVPMDECFRLVGLIRTHWSGLSGGTEVWKQIAAFFAGLHGRARPAVEVLHA
jgi:hypothetical protein